MQTQNQGEEKGQKRRGRMRGREEGEVMGRACMPLTLLRNKLFTPPKEPLVKLAMPLDAKTQSKLATVNTPKII